MAGTDKFFHDKAVLITGASSGIGEELALQLGRAGAKLTLAARRAELLEAVVQKIAAGAAAQALPARSKEVAKPLAVACDVTRDGDLERAVAESVRHWGKLDIAIANAGFGVVGPLKKLSLEDYRRQFETNVFGVLRTIYAALPEVEKTRGNIAIMGSISGWGAAPGTSPYAMSKFALRALANSITPELQRCGVKVTLISPGFVDSNIRRIDNRGNFHPRAKDPVPAWLVMDTGKAVRQMLRAIARGRREVVITGHGKILVALERFAPWIVRAVGKRMAASKAGS
jgi:NAD(P)-dependent dehydrogenase (short-subunit alcohol dehydrogenase family)